MTLRNPYCWFISLTFWMVSVSVSAQCTNYTITVTNGFFPSEIYWELTDPSLNLYASGGAGVTTTVCLTNGTYYFDMYDSWGDGWNAALFTISCPNGTMIYNGTLSSGSYGWYQLNLSGASCGSVAPCPGGTEAYTLQITSGAWPGEIGWGLWINGSNVAAGGAPSTVSLCLTPGCYEFNMEDFFGDGWNGAQYILTNAGGTVVQSGTLSVGSFSVAYWPIGGAGCSTTNPVTASDCVDAVDVCEDLAFAIDPNGFGAINEIPAPGSFSNPIYNYSDGLLSPWGTDNFGCLQSGETNSTWMVVNIWGSGWLEFTFGGLGMQTGYYDWIMYPYDDNTCQDVYFNALAPVRCNWNLTSFGGTGLASALPAGGNPGNYETPLYVNAGEQYLIVFSNWSSISTTVPLQFGGSAIVSCQSLSVATELVDFFGESTFEGVALQWITSTESQTLNYFVERSANGVEGWKPVGTLSAAGESLEEITYTLLDEGAAAGENFYRLFETEQSGLIRRIADCVVVYAPGEIPWVWPNPSNGTFQGPTWMANEKVMILDVTGREIQHTLLHPCAGCSVQIEMNQYPAGVYFLKIERTGESQRFLVAD